MRTIAPHRVTPPVPKPELTPELRQELNDIVHLAVDVLGYKQLTELHVWWFLELLTNDKLLFLAPRSHFKSTCITVVYAIHRILKDPSVRILIINEILDNAKGFLREIKAHLQSQRFQDEYGSHFSQGASKWSETAITVPSDRLSKDPTVGVAGTLGTIVSRHCDLLLIDDPISIRNSQTMAQRSKIERWFLETLTPILEPDGQEIVTGTRWHFDDLYGNILKPEKFTKWRKIELKAEWTDDDGVHHVLFPKRFSAEKLADLRADMGEAYYNSQYLNDPTKLQGQRFKFDWLVFYETPPATMRIFQGTDLAISKRDGAAFFALVTIGVPMEGDVYLLDYRYEHLDFPQQCEAIKSGFRVHRPDMVGIESVAYQEALPQWLRIDPEARRVPIVSLPSRGDKVARITALAPLFEQGVIRIRKDQHEFIDEFLAFPSGGTWDLLDALNMAIEVSREQELEPDIIEINL